METTPKFLQGVYSFEGSGLNKPALLDRDLVYWVPRDRRAQLIYFRAGNSFAELICLSLIRDGKPMRLFPIGAKSDSHVSLAVVEDLLPETKIEVFIAAPAGTAGTVVLDIGLIEI
jgi:hypothetical protein